MKAKSIRKQKVEGEFGSLLCQLTPAPELFAIAKTMLRDLWAHACRKLNAVRLSPKGNRGHLEQDRATGRAPGRNRQSSPYRSYETQIAKLEEPKTALTERGASNGQPRMIFEAVSRTADVSFRFRPFEDVKTGDVRIVGGTAHHRSLTTIAHPHNEVLSSVFQCISLTSVSCWRLRELGEVPIMSSIPEPGI